MARSAVLAGRTFADLVRNAFILTLQLGVGVTLAFRWQTSIWHLLAAMWVTVNFVWFWHEFRER
ncbi:hypothetical protein ASG92_25005 [Arthrobacter sp. Soil736]|uniref:hypothetical protein n=1 Tax=Arthrobacter sp. Soil736 TaxID=1736395 RepID=UPI0006FB0303|nr:hypothetical protein [Arthrobacter sp. Soil736]KRE52932.1 hypothetical protein ASG92_25005 [Arthrobacter sp. Soil736]